jgi:hypothetical protein
VVAGKSVSLPSMSRSLGRKESMQIAVVVPNENDESATREGGIATAKDFAREFADVPLQHFPLPAPRVADY